MTTKPETPKGNQPYVHAWHALLVMFVLAMAISAYNRFAIGGGNILNTIDLAEAFGGGSFLAALPAIVIVPWRLIQKRRGRTNAPIVVGAILFAAFALLTLKGAAIQSGV